MEETYLSIAKDVYISRQASKIPITEIKLPISPISEPQTTEEIIEKINNRATPKEILVFSTLLVLIISAVCHRGGLLLLNFKLKCILFITL